MLSELRGVRIEGGQGGQGPKPHMKFGSAVPLCHVNPLVTEELS